MEALIQLLKAVYPLTPALEAHLRTKIKPYKFKKGVDIVKAGDVANLILFIEKGFIRSYSVKDGKRGTNYFMREGAIIISVVSFLKQVPALESIEALEECICWGITHEELEEAYRLFRGRFNVHGRLILQEYYCQSEIRHYTMHNKTPEEIYADLMEKDPALLRRAKADHMASYLDISRDTYHRTKREYAQKKRR